MYAGDPTLAEDDEGQAQKLHVIGFAKFFVIDKEDQSPSTIDDTDDPNFVADTWKDGEIRGHFLGYMDGKAPPAGIKYPVAPFADPR